MPKDTTAVPQPAGKAEAAPSDKRLPYWAIITKELDDLGLTKAEFRIFCHICRRAGAGGVCNDKIRTLARVTRTDPRWARWVISKLRARKLVVRTRRHGDTNLLEPAPKFEWLAQFGTDADKVDFSYEETTDDIREAKLWARLWTVIPNAPRAPFQAQVRKDRWLFERVLADVEDRVKRGNRVGPDRLDPVKNPRGLWNYTWALFEKANPSAGRGTL